MAGACRLAAVPHGPPPPAAADCLDAQLDAWHTAQASITDQQEEQQVQEQQQQQQQAQPSAPRQHHGSRRAPHHRGGTAAHSSQYVPESWRAAAAAAADPLASQMVRAIDEGRALKARHAFDSLLSELGVEAAYEAGVEAALAAEAALASEGGDEEPWQRTAAAKRRATVDATRLAPGARARLPSLTAWKLYFAALDASNATPALMAVKLHAMHALGHTHLAAPYAALLKRCSEVRWGRMALSKVLEMKERGLVPSFQCLLYAIDAARRSGEPGYTMRLFEEVWAGGHNLSARSRQGTEYGRQSLAAIMDMARWGRFSNAFQLIDEQVGDVPAVRECIDRLAATKHRFQVSPDERSKIWCHAKVDEGSLLEALEVAAAKADPGLADAAWALLRRSLAQPNTPGLPMLQARFRGAQGGEDVRAVAIEEGSADEEVDEELPVGGGAAAAAAVPAEPPPAPEPEGGGGQWEGAAGAPPEVAAAVREFLSSTLGVRLPEPASYHALIHAHAAAGSWAGMFSGAALLEEERPDAGDAIAYHSGLQMCVDGLGCAGTAGVDAAYFLLEDWAREGKRVSAAQANLVLAACCQLGDLQRAFETFDALPLLGVQPDADSYNALLQGCVETGEAGAAERVLEEMAAAGVAPNAHTHHLLVDAQARRPGAPVVKGDVPGMAAALDSLEAAGHTPKTGLLERCVARCERAGEREAMKPLLERLFRNDYRIVGLDAMQRRWASEGGMPMLTGSSRWVSREDVLREMRGDGAAPRRPSQRLTRQRDRGRRGPGRRYE
eukprot:scaffold28.g7544.t1